jgi:hypothetical protein
MAICDVKFVIRFARAVAGVSFHEVISGTWS